MTLVWEELPAWWQADVRDPASRNVFDERSVVGMTRAAIRSQKRAKRLGFVCTSERSEGSRRDPQPVTAASPPCSDDGYIRHLCQTVYGPPLNTHSTCLDGPATVRISSAARPR